MDETVKTPKPSGRRAPHLERDKVVTAALSLLNEVGFEGMTLRKLGDKLGVKAAALYWHFENKQDLIDQVAAAIVDEEMRRTTLPADADWRAVLTVLAHATRDAFMRYRDGALVIASADLSKGGTLRGREAVTERLLELNMPASLITYSFFAVGRYTLGCVLEEQADPHSTSERAAMRHEVSAINEAYPAVARTITTLRNEGTVLDSATLFNEGFNLILDGIAVRFQPTSS
jgi:TetR/AcrR family tetracycline transcriptional repressor